MSAVLDEDRSVDSDFEIRILEAPLGAEVVGLDLSQPLSDTDFLRIHATHLDHHLLVFRGQRITPQHQIDFSRRFGPLPVHVLRSFQLSGHPEVLVVSNGLKDGKPAGLGDAGVFWHAKELPSKGGETRFANMHLAYDTLPVALRRAVQGVRAEHSYLAHYDAPRRQGPWRPALTPEQIHEVLPISHPVVRVHPETGRRALFLSERFTTRILGLPEDESRELLRELLAHSARPEHIYRHRWQPYDLLFWDNRSLMHLTAA